MNCGDKITIAHFFPTQYTASVMLLAQYAWSVLRFIT